jgi:hypothetical protein
LEPENFARTAAKLPPHEQLGERPPAQEQDRIWNDSRPLASHFTVRCGFIPAIENRAVGPISLVTPREPEAA